MPKSVLRYTWYPFFCLLLPLVQDYNIFQGPYQKLASITLCHIFSYSLCPSAAFEGEMIEFLLFPKDILLQ